MKIVKIYTDGSCKNNPGKGGFAAILTYGKHRKEVCGYKENTTNNRMELTAAIEALKAMKKFNVPIIVYSDSQLLINGMNQWINNWIRKNWKKADGNNVLNVDLWKQLVTLSSRFKSINWIKVKGHSDCRLNEEADQLAKEQWK